MGHSTDQTAQTKRYALFWVTQQTNKRTNERTDERTDGRDTFLRYALFEVPGKGLTKKLPLFPSMGNTKALETL